MFGFAAPSPCLLGIYAVFAAIQRRRELAIRSACGAEPARLVYALIVPELLAVVIGTVLGLAGSIVLVQSLRSLLYGVGPLDPLAFAIAIGSIVSTVTIAAIPSAWRTRNLGVAWELKMDPAGG